VSQALVFGGSWQGSFADLANIVQYIRGIRAFGRLSLRNLEHISVVHFYFRAGKLVHIAGYRGDARAMLADIRGWRRIGTNLGDPTRKKGGGKGNGRLFRGTVKKNLEETDQEKRHAISEVFYDERGNFTRKWEPG